MNSAAIALLVGHDLRRRWVSVVAIALLGGLAAGASLAALAGARRIDSAFERHLEASRAAHVEINPGGFDPESDRQLRRLEGVEEASFWAAVLKVVVDDDDQPLATADQPITFASDGRFYDMDRLAVLAGRLPERTSQDEAAINRELRDRLHLRVGSTIRLDTFAYDREGVPYLVPGESVEKVRVVGVVEFNDDVVVDPLDRVGRLMLSPAHLPRGPDAANQIDYPWYGLRLGEGVGVGQVDRAWSRIVTDHNNALSEDADSWQANVHSTAEVRDRSERGVRPLVTGLGVFGVIGLVATVAVLSLTLTRFVRTAEDDLRAARMLGLDGRSTLLSGLSPAVIAVGATAVVTAIVAIACSVFFPVGPFSRIEPNPGVAVDLVVILAGVLFLSIPPLTAAVVAVTAQLRSAPVRSADVERPSRLGGLLVRLGLPPAPLLGFRYALEPGRGASAVPTRATLASVAVAVAVLVATTVFGASLGDLADQPERFGWRADAMWFFESGYSHQTAEEIGAQLKGHSDVLAYRPVAADRTLVNGTHVPAVLLPPGAAGLAPTLIEGDAPERAWEVVLGAETLADVGGRLNGTVKLGPDEHEARVTGVAVFPVIGPAVSAHTGLGQGAWLHVASWPALTDMPTYFDGPMFNFVLLQTRPGTKVADLDRTLSGARASAEGQGLDNVLGVLRPAEVDTAVSLGTGQVVMAGLIMTVAVVALALTLMAVVRRRGRDLALHRALGFTPRQAGSTTVWQALVTVGAALLIGVPAGVALGRWLWIGFAGQINVVTTPSSPLLLLSALVLGLIVVAVLVSLVPAVIAARTRPAVLLRTE